MLMCNIDVLYDDDALVQRLAQEACRAMPYAPYSNYPVHAAVAVRDGDTSIAIFHGANYEVVSFNQTMHAEHSAITAALNERLTPNTQIIEAVYVRTKDGGTPCGHCRQIINEFAASDNIPIFVQAIGSSVKLYTMKELLPYAFDVSSLSG